MYQYHGAEHKTVLPSRTAIRWRRIAVQKYSTYHPRCGTSFLMTVMIISILVYTAIPVTTFWARFGIRIALLPVIAGRVVRDHSLCRQASRIAVRPDDRPGPLAAAHHHAASVGRPGGMRHYAPSTTPWTWRKQHGGELVIA